MLRELHRRRNYRPIADTIHELLETTRAHAAFAFRKGGERVLANVYRLSLENSSIEQLTAVDTGISGITPSSPALSLSLATGGLALVVLENDHYNIYIRDVATPAETPSALAFDAAVLPPTDRMSGVLATWISDPGHGLPAPQPSGLAASSASPALPRPPRSRLRCAAPATRDSPAPSPCRLTAELRRSS